MGTEKKVISSRNFASKIPTHSTLTYLLISKVFDIGWVWGMMWTLVALTWIVFFANIIKYDEVETDVFTGKPHIIE